MIPKYQKISTINVRLLTDKPVRKTPYQVKGVIMNQHSNNEIVPMLDGTYREKFLYPRVQVKILDEQIYFIGIGEGVDAIKEVLEDLKTLDFGNITFEISDIEIEEYNNRLCPSTNPLRYRFITPWVALNHSTIKKYRHLKNKDRVHYLNQLLGQNIAFISRELGIELEENIFTKLNLSTLLPKKMDENNWAAFEGEFETNFILPNYIGIGNGITRGYGTLRGLFNFNKNDILETEEAASALSDFQEIDVNKIPNSNKIHKRKKSKPKRSKKILNEEFDIENHKVKSNKPRRHKNSKQNNNINKNKTRSKQKKSTGEINYNSEEYHKKQHQF